MVSFMSSADKENHVRLQQCITFLSTKIINGMNKIIFVVMCTILHICTLLFPAFLCRKTCPSLFSHVCSTASHTPVLKTPSALNSNMLQYTLLNIVDISLKP